MVPTLPHTPRARQRPLAIAALVLATHAAPAWSQAGDAAASPSPDAVVARTDPASALEEVLYLEEILGHTDEALARYATLAEGGPSRVAARARLGVGRCLQRLGRHEEALRELHRALREHADRLDVAAQALELINAYKVEAEASLRLSVDLVRLRRDKDLLEQRLDLAQSAARAAERDRAELKAMSDTLDGMRREIRALEREQVLREKDASRLLAELGRQEAEREKVSSDLAERFLGAASEHARQGRHAEALRLLLLARQYSPRDPRIDSWIAATLPSLGEGGSALLDQLRQQAGQTQRRLELDLERARERLRAIAEVATKEPLDALGPLRRFVLELDLGLDSSPVAGQARTQLIEIMSSGWVASQVDLGQRVKVPGSDEELGRYALPEPAAETATEASGGLASLSLDRRFLPVASEPFVPPTVERRRQALFAALAEITSLDQPRAPSFAVATGRHLLVLAPPAVHAELEALLARFRDGFDRTQELQVQLVQLPPGTTAPWASLLVDPETAGDGALQRLDRAGTLALLRALAESGSTSPMRKHSVGGLRAWGETPAVLAAQGKDTFLVGRREVIAASGATSREAVTRTVESGFTLAVRVRAEPAGLSMAIDYASARVLRPSSAIATRDGTIQLPSSARQLLRARALVPHDGCVLVFGLADPLPEDPTRPGEIAFVVAPAPEASPPAASDVQRITFGDEGSDVPDLGGRAPLPGRALVYREYLAGADAGLVIDVDGAALLARGPPAALAAMRTRLERLQALARTPVRVEIHAWSIPASSRPALAALVTGRAIGDGQSALPLDPTTAAKVKAGLSALPGAVSLELPPGPYAGPGASRLVASRIATTRYLREPGPPPRYDQTSDGLAIALVPLPDEAFDIRFQLAKLHALASVQRAGTTTFEPRRTLVSGQLGATIPIGHAALLSGIRDPSDANRQVVVLLERQANGDRSTE